LLFLEVRLFQMPEKKAEMVSVSLPKAVIRELKWLADKKRVPLLKALTQAISTESFVLDEIEKHGSVLIQKKNKIGKSIKEIREIQQERS